MRSFASFPSPALALAAAADYADCGPGIQLGSCVLYPAVQVGSWFHSAELLCRVAESDLWVRSWEVDGLTTRDAVLLMARPLTDLVREMAALGQREDWLSVFEDHESPEWVSLREVSEQQGF